MTEYERAINEIRCFIQSRNWGITPAIRAAATPYAQACEEANRRLSQCAAFLRQGHLTEALHLAQTEPVLLDMIAILDFPEREQWQELALANGLPASGGFNLEFAEALNSAYAVAHPLEKPLRKHRILALARADLRLRLDTLRELATIDPDNAIWKEDVAVFEKARLREIEGDLKQAMNAEDGEKVRSLCQELQSPAWSCSVPVALKTTANRWNERQAEKAVRAELEQVQRLLAAALAATDVERGRALRARWKSLISKGAAVARDPLAQRAAPALDWLAQEDVKAARRKSFNRAIEELNHALDASSTPKELESCYQAVIAYTEYEVPRELVGRYYRESKQRQRSKRRNVQLIILSAGALTMLCIVGIAFSIWNSNQNSAAAQASSDLARLLEEKKLEEARDYLKRLEIDSPSVFILPSVTAVSQKVHEAAEAEEKRSAAFGAALEDARKDPVDPVEGPNLALARRLARKPSVEAETRMLESVLEERKRKSAGRLEDLNVPRRLDEARARLTEFTSRSEVDQAGLDKLEKEVDELRSILEKGPDAPHRLVEELRRAVANARSNANETMQKAKAVQKATRASKEIARLNEYISALEELNRIAPNRDFAHALSEKQVWADAADWNNQVFERWPGSLAELKPNQAKMLVRLLDEERGKYPNTPALDEMRKCLAAIADQERADESLRNLFRRPIVSGVWIYAESDNQKDVITRFYLTEKSKNNWEADAKREKGLSVSFASLKDFDGAEGKHVRQWSEQCPPTPAPHSIIAKNYLSNEGLGAGATGIWEKAVIDMIDRIRNDQEMEPILRLWFLNEVLNSANRGSVSLQKATAEMVLTIKDRVDFIHAPWMALNGKDPAHDEARKEAMEVFRELPSTKNLHQKVDQARTSVQKGFRESRLTPIGWLLRNGPNWKCCSEFTTTNPAEVCVVYPVGKTVACESIGRLQPPNQISLIPPTTAGFIEGRLVFVRAGSH